MAVASIFSWNLNGNHALFSLSSVREHFGFLPSIMFLNSVKLMTLLVILSDGSYMEEGMRTSRSILAGMLLFFALV
jgi:hypothetical protein